MELLLLLVLFYNIFAYLASYTIKTTTRDSKFANVCIQEVTKTFFFWRYLRQIAGWVVPLGDKNCRSIQRDWDIKVQTGTDISFNLFFFSLVCFCKAYSELSFELFLCVCVC